MFKISFFLLATIASQIAQAEHECKFIPHNDLILNQDNIEIKGENDDLLITLNGKVIYNGNLYVTQQKKAKDYQKYLRSSLQKIDRDVHVFIEKYRIALYKILYKEIKEDTNINERLNKLYFQIKKQLNSIIEHSSNRLIFHYKAIDYVRNNSLQLVNQIMKNVFQDSINEVLKKPTLKNEINTLQKVLNNLNKLQNAIQNEWEKQKMNFSKFSDNICKDFVLIETKRKALIQSLIKY